MTAFATPLEGEWKPFRAEMDGAQAPELVIKRSRLIVRGSRYRVVFAGETSDQGTLTVVEAEGVISLEMTSSFGENDGRLLRGLFQLKGDLLRICLGLEGQLPTDFTAPASSGRYLILYRRA